MNSFLLLPPPKKCTHEETPKKVVQVLASIPDDACQHGYKLLLTAPFTFASIVIKRGHDGDFLEQPIYIADANLFFSNVLNAERTTIRLVVVCKTYDFFYCLLFFENLLRLIVKLQLVLLEKHETYRYGKGEVVVLASYCMLHKTEKCASIDSCQNTKLDISCAMPRVKTRLDN